METVKKDFKLTDQEHEFLRDKFVDGCTLYRKIKLYGAGHPSLPGVFFVKGNQQQRDEFWNEHETTHAKFIPYNSFVEMANDKNLIRSDIVHKGNEINDFSIPTYHLI